MKTWIAFAAVVVLLVASVAENVVQMSKLTAERDYEWKEFEYAAKAAKQVFTIVPEDGMQLLSPPLRKPAPYLTIAHGAGTSAGSNPSVRDRQSNLLYYYSFGMADCGSVDASRVGKTISRHGFDPDSDMTAKYIVNGGLPMAGHILVRFLRQIEVQGNWIYGDTNPVSTTCAYGCLVNPSGTLTLIVHRDATNTNLFHIGFVRTFSNRTVGKWGHMQSMYLSPCGKSFDPSK